MPTPVPRGNTSDLLKIGATVEVLDGPNLQSAPDNLGQLNKADGTFMQEDCTRRKVSGTQKVAVIDAAAVLPAGGGEAWTITGASAAPYIVMIDGVNYEGQNEDGYELVSIPFHYFEAVTAGQITLASQTTSGT